MINWSEFEKLPGSANYNFEVLCRSLIWTHYNRHGTFKAISNQPGIEFDLQLNADCALGKVGMWLGWQCRWWDLPSGKAIGTNRRNKIIEAINQTFQNKPDITDWILWTRHTLTKRDQDWFYSIKTKFKLQLWTSYEAETLLSGDAEIFKQTYFGSLVLTPERLSDLHQESVAPIHTRWLPEAHQPVEAERELRKMLGERSSWAQLLQVAENLTNACTILKSELNTVPASLSIMASNFIATLLLSVESLKNASELLEAGDLKLLRQILEDRPKSIDPIVASLPRKLRGARLPCGLMATNALAYLKSSYNLFHELDKLLKTGIVAVVADAGGGKTQLSAELTADNGSRPAGVLLLGRNLRHGQTLHDLAKRIVINNEPVKSMQALLAAVNTAGDRAKCRLPIVIDGLNEAEDPREWKPLLASINKILPQYSNVLIICTLRTGARIQSENDRNYLPQSVRTSFADQALPDDIRTIEIPDFQDNTIDAIAKYLDFFRIKVDIVDLPINLLSHPLTLRVFCEVTNPKRDSDVGMETIPRSLAAMFARYIDRAAERIEELSSITNRHFRQDIYKYLDVIGQCLWENRSRELNEKKLRQLIADDQRSWNNSIITLFEQEGIILRLPGESSGMESIMPVYDLLGGYLIANYLISSLGRVKITSWLREKSTIEAFSGDYSVRHPLAQDTFRFLAALIPQQLFRQQLWQLVEEPLRTEALELATLLEGRYIDADTIEAISTHILQNESTPSRFFRRLVGVRSAADHPLNATFLDSVLRKLNVSRRDIVWTEWVRKNEKACFSDLDTCIENWKDNLNVRTPSDVLKAKWIMWLLTTTIIRLRDTATLALYWFGRGNPAKLFDLTESSVDVNDPYVMERVAAASYGVAMAVSVDSAQLHFRTNVLPVYAKRIYDLLFETNAPFRNTHVLTRQYSRWLSELAVVYNAELFSVEQLSKIRPPYVNGGRIDWQKIKANKREKNNTQSPLNMDFENYTIGHLVKGRRNYDYEHKEYQIVRAQILWRISNLGWSESQFKEIENDIERSRRNYSRHSNDINKVDRYGKKYSWIAYFELDGWLQDRGLRDMDWEDSDRTWDADIDPTFPESTPDCKLIDRNLLDESVASSPQLTKNPEYPDLSPYFIQASVQTQQGPWIMLDGYVRQENERGHVLFAFVRSFLVSDNEKNELISFLQRQRLGGRWLPEKPECHYTYSGEIPWSETFPDLGTEELEFQFAERVVKTKKKVSTFFLDGQPINLSYLDRLRLGHFLEIENNDEEFDHLSKDQLTRLESKTVTIDVDEVENEMKKFQVIIPVCDIRTPGKTLRNTSAAGTTLTKALAKCLNLVNVPQTYDLQNQEGERVTTQISFAADSYKNSESFFFIRRNELHQILKRQKMSLILTVWGEREIGQSDEIYQSNYKQSDFQEIYVYSTKKGFDHLQSK